MSIVIDNMEIKAIPIKPKTIEFDKDGRKEIYVDATGQRVNKIQVQGSEYKWTYEDGSEYTGKSYKAIKGKAVKPFSKTTVIKSYERISITELPYFINNELTYLLVNEDFKARLKEKPQEALSFKFVNRGFKVYRGVAYFDEQLGKSLLRLFRGDLRKVELPEDVEVNEIESAENVAEMSLEDLEV